LQIDELSESSEPVQSDPRCPMAARNQPPKAVGLYDPAYEKDACGVGFIAGEPLRRARWAAPRRCSCPRRAVGA